MMLDDRKSAILQALVEEHIRTGEPVSSRAILDASGLGVSSATVRNELGRLETEGFVSQPHTSAGRVPTDKTYRYYVDHLSPMGLRPTTRGKIEGFFTSVQLELGRLLQKTSDLLAEITHYPAVVLGPGMSSDVIHGVNLVRLGPEMVLVILISESGVVAKDMVKLPRPATAGEMRAAEEMLIDAFTGRSIADAMAAIEAMPAGREPDEAVRQVVDVAVGVAKRSEEITKDVYVGGASQLASLWADLGKVHRLLEFLEREAMVHALLGRDETGTSVRIGAELELVGDDDIAVVSTSYELGRGGRGRVGVLGPKRMDYRRTIRVVEEVGEGLGDSLGG